MIVKLKVQYFSKIVMIILFANDIMYGKDNFTYDLNFSLTCNTSITRSTSVPFYYHS